MAKKKDITIKVLADQIMHTGISVSKDGYKSARMLVKIRDKEYLSISYEWEGDNVPGFVMEIMSFIQANEEVIKQSGAEKSGEDAAYIERQNN